MEDLNQLASAVSSSNGDGPKTSSCPLFSKVVDLVYWKDLKKSGIVFGAGLVLLFSLVFYTVLSLVAYVSLLALAVTISFRIYKNILAAVQKSQDGHPFKEYLEKDIEVSKGRAHHIADTIICYVNKIAAELRRLFLAEDLVDSIKFGILLWLATYIGAWFNGLTLAILAFVAAFTFPKVYETHKEQIDGYVKIAHDKINEFVDLAKSKVPGLKPKEQ